jgi:hypothetical protein
MLEVQLQLYPAEIVFKIPLSQKSGTTEEKSSTINVGDKLT